MLERLRNLPPGARAYDVALMPDSWRGPIKASLWPGHGSEVAPRRPRSGARNGAATARHASASAGHVAAVPVSARRPGSTSRPLSAPAGSQSKATEPAFAQYVGPMEEGGAQGRLIARERRRLEDLAAFARRRDEALFWVAKGMESKYTSTLPAYPFNFATGTTYSTDYANHGLEKEVWSAFRSDNHTLRPDSRFMPTSLV